MKLSSISTDGPVSTWPADVMNISLFFTYLLNLTPHSGNRSNGVDPNWFMCAFASQIVGIYIARAIWKGMAPGRSVGHPSQYVSIDLMTPTCQRIKGRRSIKWTDSDHENELQICNVPEGRAPVYNSILLVVVNMAYSSQPIPQPTWSSF